MAKLNLSLGGMELSVPAYYEGQPTALAPDHYVTRDEAIELKRKGKASSINRGKAILLSTPRIPVSGRVINNTKRGWKVVGQTPRGATSPGFPRWNLVK